MEVVKVKILDNGISAKEVNHEGENPKKYKWLNDGKYQRKVPLPPQIKWQEAESKLRTFKIAGARPEWSRFDTNNKACLYTTYSAFGTRCFLLDEIHSAEILDNNKLTIRIL